MRTGRLAHTTSLLAVLLALVALAPLGAIASARTESPQGPPTPQAAGPPIATSTGVTPAVRTIERVEFRGLARTRPHVAARIAALVAGAPADFEAILAATERLRASGLFRSVEPSTRPGEAPDGIVLEFVVVETRPHLRFGVGYEDFSSWYLVPAQFAADNLTGRGESLRLAARIGYRVAGADLAFRSTTDPAARRWWELRVFGEGVDRVYWLDSTETRHHLNRGGAQLTRGVALGRGWAMEAWLGAEGTRPDSNATVYADREALGREKGDEVPFESLPYEIRRDVRERGQARLGLALVRDRRVGAALAARGTWARFSVEGAYSELGDYATWQADVRGYAPVSPLAQLAVRARAGAVASGAPFYERFAIGGLYTVRGYPSQALSPPQGTLNFGAASVEFRHAWAGHAANPRFTAIAFADAAIGWNRERPSLSAGAGSIGAGFRVRVPWFGQAGVDVARPLSRSPVDEAFRVHGSLGWSF